jgi:hypothetical protein
MEYTLATHFRSGSVRHVIESTCLVVESEKKGSRTILFADVEHINLRCDMPGVFSVRIKPFEGAAVTIPSRHFKGVGQFEERNAEYVAFLGELHRAGRAASPRILFVAGSSVLYGLGWFFLVVAALFGVALVYGLMFVPTPPPLRAFLSVPLLIVVGGAFIKQGAAKTYDPSAPPPKFLPPTAFSDHV